MHLQFDGCGRAQADSWIVVDDFGTVHDAVHKGRFGGFSDGPARQRSQFLYSQDDDPDVQRAYWCRPELHCARESTAFASPIGLSIEAAIRIDFELRPAWDERTSTPLFTQAEGATITILHAAVNEWDWCPASTAIAQRALEAFCWAYIDMKRAREAEEHRTQKGAEQ